METIELRRIMNIEIHNTNYKEQTTAHLICDLFSDIAQQHTKILGVDVATLNRQGYTWMLHKLHIIFNRMPHLGEQIEILTHPAGIDKLFSQRCYRISVADTKEELIKASSDWMIIDIERRRPIRPTERLIEINANLRLPDDMPRNTFDKKDLPKNFNEAQHFTATFDNIDFNGHVTQASYMQWISNSLSFEFHKQHSLKEIEIIYEHEILPEAEIISLVNIENSNGQTTIWHKLVSPDNQIEHCYARSIWFDENSI